MEWGFESWSQWFLQCPPAVLRGTWELRTSMELMAKLSHSARPLHGVPASGGRELPPAPDPSTKGEQKQVATPTRKQPGPLLHGISQCHISFCLLVRVLPPERDPGQSSNQLQKWRSIRPHSPCWGVCPTKREPLRCPRSLSKQPEDPPKSKKKLNLQRWQLSSLFSPTLHSTVAFPAGICKGHSPTLDLRHFSARPRYTVRRSFGYTLTHTQSLARAQPSRLDLDTFPSSKGN